jgi:YesN/AraC family two-component response regulator
MGILALVIIILAVILYQNFKLNKAHKKLVEKNAEIIDIQDNLPEIREIKETTETKEVKTKKYSLPEESQNELLEKILKVMEDTSIICDSSFSVDKLAALTQSNHKYVSDVIKLSLKTNFRAFVNSYRIKEAQRLLSCIDIERFTIETISEQVGFKSRSSFYDVFKAVTGISPRFYMMKIQEKNKNS